MAVVEYSEVGNPDRSEAICGYSSLKVPLTIFRHTLAAMLLMASTLSATAQKYALLQAGDSHIQLDVEGATPDLPFTAIQQHVQQAAQAVVLYYGRFPVVRARVVVTVINGQDGVLQGTTWGDRDGYPAETLLRIGQHTTQAQLDKDWVMTHELIHMALPSLPDAQRWLEEGISTYVEPVARVQTGQLEAGRIWGDMVAGMYHGEPEPGDRGLDRTHTWGRTYWGGALFCLTADVAIRKQTNNKRGLQDALTAVVKAGGAINQDWRVLQVLKVGDEATGTSVLEDLYAKWSVAPVDVDLPMLWSQLGIRQQNGKVTFDGSAPDAQLRIAITKPR